MGVKAAFTLGNLRCQQCASNHIAYSGSHHILVSDVFHCRSVSIPIFYRSTPPIDRVAALASHRILNAFGSRHGSPGIGMEGRNRGLHAEKSDL